MEVLCPQHTESGLSKEKGSQCHSYCEPGNRESLNMSCLGLTPAPQGRKPRARLFCGADNRKHRQAQDAASDRVA